jgi:extradiol dioxygenase family protein
MSMPFHLAIPVDNLELCSRFYLDVLGCTPGRSSEQWLDLNFFDHQLVLHVDPTHNPKKHHNDVDGKSVPVPHFGVILDWEIFISFAERLKKNKVEFVIEPYLRFEGLPGEQMTLFFYDPAGNALEFKSFKNKDQIFAF